MAVPLHIIVPCYNPHEGWEIQLARQVRGLQELLPEYRTTIILVNDASQSGVEEEQINYLKANITDFHYLTYTANQGKGFAVRHGVAAVNDGLILYTDIDFPYELESMCSIVRSLEKGNDIAIGTRDNEYYENTPQRRKWISKILRYIFRVIFRLPLTDTQCGLKGFNQAGKRVFMQTTINRFLFDMEFIAIASKTPGVRLEPVYVKLRNNIVFSRMSPKTLLKESWNFIKILRITRRHQPYEQN